MESKAFNLKLHLTEDLAGRKFTFDIFVDGLEEAYTEIQGLAGCIHLHNLPIYVAYSRFYQRDFEKSILINNHNPETNSLDIAITFPNKISLKRNQPIGELVIVVANEIDIDDCFIEIADFITINAEAKLSKGIDTSYTFTELLPRLSHHTNTNLSQNNPNPFTKQTIINYQLPEVSQSARLKIFTATGALAKTIPIDHSNKTGRLIIDSNDLQAGLYVYTLIVNNKTFESKKMIVQQ